MDYFRGMYSRFGGLRGSPMVPDGWYGPPGHRGGRLKQKNVSGDNFRAALPYTIQGQSKNEIVYSKSLQYVNQLTYLFC